MLYDIHLSMGCRTLPDMKDLVGEIPSLNNRVFQQKLLIPSPANPGFLGLDLPEPLAKKLFHHLKSTRAVGYWLPSIYRQLHISKDQAAIFAEQALPELSTKHYQHCNKERTMPVSKKRTTSPSEAAKVEGSDSMRSRGELSYCT